MSEGEISKTVSEVVKHLSSEIYGDALKPGMQQIGKALETVIGFGNTILTPFAMVNDRVKHVRELNLQKLQNKLQEIPIDKIGTISPEIAVPVLQKLEYTENKELAELFLNLLTSSASIDSAHLAHPSFVNIISNLSPDEARILQYLRKNNIGICTVYFRINKFSRTYSDFFLNTTVFESKNILVFPQNMKVYLNNLSALGLISSYGTPSNDPQYNELEKYLEPKVKTILEENKEVESTHYKGILWDQ